MDFKCKTQWLSSGHVVGKRPIAKKICLGCLIEKALEKPNYLLTSQWGKKCFIIISPLSSDFLALALSCDGFAMAGKTLAMQEGRRGGCCGVGGLTINSLGPLHVKVGKDSLPARCHPPQQGRKRSQMNVCPSRSAIGAPSALRCVAPCRFFL